MKSLLSLVLLVSLMTNSSAQIKKQYRDSIENTTIVVVKEDKANDQELLDEYFNLNEVSMNDQIMITTGTEAETNQVETTASINSNNTIPNAQIDISEKSNNPALSSSNVRKASTRASSKGTYEVKSRLEVLKAQEKKYFKGKKTKKKKRRFRSKKGLCYSF